MTENEDEKMGLVEDATREYAKKKGITPEEAAKKGVEDAKKSGDPDALRRAEEAAKEIKRDKPNSGA